MPMFTLCASTGHGEDFNCVVRIKLLVLFSEVLVGHVYIKYTLCSASIERNKGLYIYKT